MIRKLSRLEWRPLAQNETIQVNGITVTVVRPVAEGAFAQVLLVRSTASNETFALKRVLCQSEEVEKDVHMELQVFRVRVRRRCTCWSQLVGLL